MEIKEKIQKMSRKDIEEIVEIGIAQNVITGVERMKLLDGSKSEMIDVLMELDDDTLEQIYLQYLGA